MSLKIAFNRVPVSIVRRLVERGYEAYIVGGAVRDLLLNHVPKDYDITTNATPEQVRGVFGRRKCRIIGRRFRLALVFECGEIYEVSTFRREPTAEERKVRDDDDGVVIWDDNKYGTLEDDVKRRDFTVNALYYDVTSGTIIDKIGGRADLRKGVVRTIGKASMRFKEDPVRMLRAIKLVGQHGLKFLPDVKKAIAENASLIQVASPARLFEELMKIMATDKSHNIFNACFRYGFLRYFCPALAEVWNTEGGDLIHELLKLRDRCIDEEKDYYEDKSLALATICLPYLLASIDLEKFCIGQYSENGIWSECFDAVRTFFSTFDIPRDCIREICEIMRIFAIMASGKVKPRNVRLELYPLAYELFRLLTMASGWMSDVFHSLPFPNETVDDSNEFDLNQ